MSHAQVHGVALGVVNHFVHQPACDEQAEAAVSQTELFADFQVADRVLFLGGVR